MIGRIPNKLNAMADPKINNEVLKRKLDEYYPANDFDHERINKLIVDIYED